MRTEMPTPICPKDAAESEIRMTLNANQRATDRFMNMALFPFCPPGRPDKLDRKNIVPQKGAIRPDYVPPM